MMIINHDCCYHHNHYWSSWRSWSGEDDHCRRYHHHHHAVDGFIIIISSSSSSSSKQHRQDIDGWWRGFFILFLNYMNWLRETYSNDSAFIILVIVSYCGQQIYFTHKHATTICSQAIPLTMNHRDLIPYRQIKTKYRNINLYHGCTAHVCHR